MLKYSSKLMQFLGVLMVLFIVACSSRNGLESTPDQRPKSLSAAPGPSAGQITISWDPALGAPSSYKLYSHPLKSGSTTTTRPNVTSPYVFSVFSPEILFTHEFQVAAVFGTTEFASDSISSAAMPRFIDAALVPQNFEARPGLEAGQIVISWDPVASTPRYELYTHSRFWPNGSLSVLPDATSPVTYTALNTDMTATHEFYLKAIAGDSEGITGTIYAMPR